MFGVRSAMPTVRARRLCPDAVFLPPDFERLPRALEPLPRGAAVATPRSWSRSRSTRRSWTSAAPRGCSGPPETIAAKIRADVEREVGVTCSVGVAPTKFVAKLASDRLQARRHARRARRRACSTSSSRCRSGGCGAWGRRPATLLGRLGIRTIGDLEPDPAGHPGPAARASSRRRHLRQLAHGIDDRDVVPYEAPKSVGHEETFERDLDDDEEILRELLALSGRVASRLRADGYRARTVTLKARLANFTTLTRSQTLPDATDVGADLYQTVAALYRALPGERRRIRLLGVQATGLLSAGAEQLALLHGERWGDVERTIDRIEQRFGRGAAQPASLLDRDRRH